jgi:hypothetical protein
MLANVTCAWNWRLCGINPATLYYWAVKQSVACGRGWSYTGIEAQTFFVPASNMEQSCGYEKLEKTLSCVYYNEHSDLKDFSS